VDVGKLWKAFPASIARLANEICNLLGSSARFSHSRVPLIENLYVGPAYGSPSADGLQALTRLARTEGILLDPVYTAKAFAGMLDQIGAGSLEPGAPVIFLHTGGVPALFAFDEQQLLLT
jgi:D-cysteine desulfhydrase